jgi:hypothetical protein
VIVSRPVVEVSPPTDFTLWPIADAERYGFLPLHGGLNAAEVGTAVASIADRNAATPEGDVEPPTCAGSIGDFLHGLLTLDCVYVPGGLRITDTATGVTLLPGCCNGLEERGEWRYVLDGGGWASFGHDPSPLAERRGDIVHLTVDADMVNSPVIELPVDELRRLLADAEQDLTHFLRLANTWAARHLSDRVSEVTAALARGLLVDTGVVPVAPPVP